MAPVLARRSQPRVAPSHRPSPMFVDCRCGQSAPEPAAPRRLDLGERLLRRNDQRAAANRRRFREAQLPVVNLLSAPGSGKTALLERLARDWPDARDPGSRGAIHQGSNVPQALAAKAARALLERVFQVVDQPWRGLGPIAGGGLALAAAYAQLDARARFGLASLGGAPQLATGLGSRGRGRGPAQGNLAAAAPVAGQPNPPGQPANPCISGAILRGRATPPDCPAFGGACTPERPLGAPMVSSEGACAAYYRYRRHD